MSTGDYLSLLINLVVGAYLGLYYPRQVRRKLANGRVPPFFAATMPLLRLLGFAVIAASLGYAGVRLLQPAW